MGRDVKLIPSCGQGHLPLDQDAASPIHPISPPGGKTLTRRFLASPRSLFQDFPAMMKNSQHESFTLQNIPPLLPTPSGQGAPLWIYRCLSITVCPFLGLGCFGIFLLRGSCSCTRDIRVGSAFAPRVFRSPNSSRSEFKASLALCCVRFFLHCWQKAATSSSSGSAEACPKPCWTKELL